MYSIEGPDSSIKRWNCAYLQAAFLLAGEAACARLKPQLAGGPGKQQAKPRLALMGLIVSQMVTLFSTPVIYLCLDQLQSWWQRRHASGKLRLAPSTGD